MSDETHSEIIFPRIPDEFDDSLRNYLMELERVLTDELSGDRFVSGSLTVGGDIVQ